MGYAVLRLPNGSSGARIFSPDAGRASEKNGRPRRAAVFGISSEYGMVWKEQTYERQQHGQKGEELVDLKDRPLLREVKMPRQAVMAKERNASVPG